MRDKTKCPIVLALIACIAVTFAFTADCKAQDKKPNIVVIWGDDTGRSNISAYSHGLMGYRTPNIDRIAREGMLFTDYYTENSCTAGRAAFIQGQAVFRTGNSKVGLPGAKQGIDAKDPTIAELLKPMGYATAQFGKNHLGDRNEYLPTVHGFDEFYGILYHLNALYEPYEPDDHDKNVGQVLEMIDKLGIADNTIVIYGTDNGPHENAWPDAGTSPFRGEKDTGWEGGFRSPTMVRWPSHIKPGQVSNDVMSNLDWMPTLLAAAGDSDIKQKLLKGHKAGDMTYRVHLDGYNFLPYLTGKAKEGPRKEFFYFSDGGDLLAMRARHIKFNFMEQDTPGTYKVWQHEFSNLRLPTICNLRTDPYEQASITSNKWWDYQMHKTFYLYPALEYASEFLATFEEFPPRHPAANLTMSVAIDKLKAMGGGK